MAANGHVQRKDTWENVLSSAENIADEEENVDRPQASQRKTKPVWLKHSSGPAFTSRFAPGEALTESSGNALTRDCQPLRALNTSQNKQNRFTTHQTKGRFALLKDYSPRW